MSRERAVVVELVGPAGAGKTTLARGVTAADSTVRSGLSLWGLPRHRLVRSAVALLPTILGASIRRTPLRAGELAQMIRLGALRHEVEDEAARHRVIILDEGPVFALSWLEVFFSRNGDRVPASWRRRVVAEWATLLDVVVFIDACDITLANRIRTREKLVANAAMVRDRPAAQKIHPIGFSGLRAAMSPPTNPKAIRETSQTTPGPSTTIRPS